MVTGRIEIQLELLYRSYLPSRQKYDLVEITRLAHDLRRWIEISKDSMYNRSVSTFQCAKPQKKLLRLFRNHNAEYLWLCSVSPVYGELFKPEFVFLPMDDKIPFIGPIYSSSATFGGKTAEGYLGFSSPYYGTNVPGTDALMKKPHIRGRLTLQQFMQCQLILFCLKGELKRFTIEDIISRSANALLDASHFQKLAERPNTGRLTDALPVMANMRVGGISLLYFTLLYIAQEILVSYGKIERIKPVTEPLTGNTGLYRRGPRNHD